MPSLRTCNNRSRKKRLYRRYSRVKTKVIIGTCLDYNPRTDFAYLYESVNELLSNDVTQQPNYFYLDGGLPKTIMPSDEAMKYFFPKSS